MDFFAHIMFFRYKKSKEIKIGGKMIFELTEPMLSHILYEDNKKIGPGTSARFPA
jgi:hypothetical protein